MRRFRGCVSGRQSGAAVQSETHRPARIVKIPMVLPRTLVIDLASASMNELILAEKFLFNQAVKMPGHSEVKEEIAARLAEEGGAK